MHSSSVLSLKSPKRTRPKRKTPKTTRGDQSKRNPHRNKDENKKMLIVMVQ